MQVNFDPTQSGLQIFQPVRPQGPEPLLRQPDRAPNSRDQSGQGQGTDQQGRPSFARATFEQSIDQRIVDDASRRGAERRAAEDRAADTGAETPFRQPPPTFDSATGFITQALAADTPESASPDVGSQAYETAANRISLLRGQQEASSGDPNEADNRQNTGDEADPAPSLADFARGVAQYVNDAGVYSASLARPGEYLELRA